MVTAMADPDRYRDQFMKNTSDKSTTPNTPPQPSLLSRSILSSSRVSHSQKLFSFPDGKLLQGQGTQLHQNPHSLALKETMDPMGRVKADMAMALQHSRYKLGSVAQDRRLKSSLVQFQDLPGWWSSRWIPGDGHCCFHVISAYINCNPDFHMEIRQQVAEAMLNDPSQRWTWMLDNPNGLDEITLMQQYRSDTWGSEQAWYYAARIFHCAFFVISTHQQVPAGNLYSPPGDGQGNNIPIYFVHHINLNHYELMVTDNWRDSEGDFMQDS